MKRLIAMAIATAGVWSTMALELDINGSFNKTDGLRFPEGWRWHDTWRGYLPLAAAEVEQLDGTNVLHFYKAEGSDGCALRTRRLVGHPGDIVNISFEAKGSGTVWYSCYRYDERGGWVGSLTPRKETLTGDWRKFTKQFTLLETKPTVNRLFEAALGINHGSEAWIRNVKVTRDVEAIETLEFDDFEKPRARSGKPTIVEADIAPGLLAKTQLGRYATHDESTISTSTLTMPPADSRSFVQSSFRIYNFGAPTRKNGELVTTLSSGEDSFIFRVRHGAAVKNLKCTFNGENAFSYPYAKLPAEFTLSVGSGGEYDLAVRSLSDSSVVSTSGTNAFLASGVREVKREVKLASARDHDAAVTLDEIRTAKAEVSHLRVPEPPYTAKPLATFDPIAAGWDLSFSDEFDGTVVDSNKWEVSHAKNADMTFVKDGILHIRTDHEPGKDKLRTGSLWSRFAQTYGYFEARLKFTTYNGWWAAFWLCTHGCDNPFLDGIEIDIFEDYYMRNPARNTLDHNLHMYGGTLKSWNYNSILPRTHKDWYTIGCKWTPFEITYYLDGKAIPAKASVSHSPYDTVTFDAFRHGTSICPLNTIVSGQIMRSIYGHHDDDEGEVFPEDYLVDYVRVYAFPGATNGVAPKVAIKSGSVSKYSLRPGALMDFRVKVKPSKKTKSPIKAVHLFDNGYHLLTKTSEPYTFNFPMTEEFYNKTRWMCPGRQSEFPPFKGSIHAFAAFAEDEEGNVGNSEVIAYIMETLDKTTPYENKPAKVPGIVKAGRYDDGGEGVAYHDRDSRNNLNKTWRQDCGVDGSEDVIGGIIPGEWVIYTIDVESDGWYKMKLKYGTPFSNNNQHVDLLVDDDRQAQIEIKGHGEEKGFGVDTIAETRIKLTTGRHVVKLMFYASFNYSHLEFEKE